MKLKSLLTFIAFITVIFLTIINESLVSFPFVILFFICLYLGSKEDFFFNPFYLFAITPLTVAIYNPSLNPYYLPKLTATTYFMIFLGLSSFILGLRIARVLKYKSFFYGNNKNIEIKNARIFWFTFILGLTPYLIGILTTGAPILSDDANEIRRTFLPNNLSYLTFLLPLSLLLAFSLNNKKLIYLATISYFLMSIVQVSKSSFLLFLVVLVFSLHKYRSLNLKRIIALSILGMMLLIGSFAVSYSVRSGSDTMNENYLIEGSKNSYNMQELISLPYLYLSTPWSNFQETITSTHKFDLGLNTLKPFTSILLPSNFISYKTTKIIYQYPFNTWAFITDFYLDFGIIGIILLSLILGFIIYSIYLNAVFFTDPFKIATYIIFAKATLLLFFSNHFTTLGYPFIVYILYKIFEKIARIKSN